MKTLTALFIAAAFSFFVPAQGQIFIAASAGTALTANDGISSQTSDLGWSVGLRIESDSSRTQFGILYEENNFSSGRYSASSNVVAVGLRHFLFDDTYRHYGAYLITEIGITSSNLIALPGIGAQVRLGNKERLFAEAKYTLGITGSVAKIIIARIGMAITF